MTQLLLASAWVLFLLFFLTGLATGLAIAPVIDGPQSGASEAPRRPSRPRLVWSRKP